MPNPSWLGPYTIVVVSGWFFLFAVAVTSAYRERSSLRAHLWPLFTLLVGATVARLLVSDVGLGEEQWPYITQAACLAFENARAGYDNCGFQLWGDSHQLGTASLFAIAFWVFGATKSVAGLVSLSASLLAVIALYALVYQAFRSRATAWLAAAVYALHPWSLHFAAATQTEALNDLMLCVGMMLALRDTRISGPRGLLDTTLFRTFFIFQVCQVRPALLILLPLYLLLPALSRANPRRAWTGLWRRGLAFLVLLPALYPVMAYKSYGRLSLEQQALRIGEHAVDFQSWMLGGIGPGLLVLVGLLVATRRSKESRSSRTLVAGCLLYLTTSLYAATSYEHIPRHQSHVVYHGSILLWPFAALTCVRAWHFAAQRLEQLRRASVQTTAALAGAAALLLLVWNTIPPVPLSPPGHAVLGLDESPYVQAVQRIPARSQVLWTGAIFSAGRLAAPLFEHRDDVALIDFRQRGQLDDAALCARVRRELQTNSDRTVFVLEFRPSPASNDDTEQKQPHHVCGVPVLDDAGAGEVKLWRLSPQQGEESMKWRELTPEETRVIVDKGTEPPFSGRYTDHKADGSYTCKRCGATLFRSDDKFDSACGWPSFDDAIPGAVREQPDGDGRRTEIVCAACGAHLGHVFRGEGMTPQNTRHCVNSISVDFEPTPTETAEAYFAGGCFWGVEHLLSQQPGVLSVESGYMGGRLDKPTYEQVCTGKTGHAEAVRVVYDPAKLRYRTLAKLFFEIHDPTQLDRQGPDVGSQYRSAVFYADPDQRRTAEDLIEQLRRSGLKVVTKMEEAKTFWPAEPHHQDYYLKTGRTPYCHARVKRFD